MIERIVRMSFEPERVADFMQVFERSKAQIAAFPGCRSLRLMQDIHHTHVLLTHSLWEREEDLEAYRKSDLFKQTWAQTKIHFNQKPIAWSIQLNDFVK